jgi:hypothetical protein
MSLRSYNLTHRESNCAEYRTWEKKWKTKQQEKKVEEEKVVVRVATVTVVPRRITAAGAAAEATRGRVWTSCARFCFHRYGKNGTGPAPA